MKRILFPLLLFFFLATLAADVRVLNVIAKNHWPWDGKLDITYELECNTQDARLEVSFQAYDRVLQQVLPATSLSGDGAAEPLSAGGPYTTTWDFAVDYPGRHSAELVISVAAEELEVERELYLVVNLEDDSIRYTNTAPDLSDDACRTTELWLRQVPAGAFTMGCQADEVSRHSGETPHQVTIEKMYYIGVFEVTQHQWELVMNSRPSYFDNADCYGTRPVEMVSYDDIRGATMQTDAGWPADGHAVGENSFLGRLQARTGLCFDLPTEAEWEKACRAGSVAALNSGKSLESPDEDANMSAVGRYLFNGGAEYTATCDTTKGTAKVGSFLPNAWGIYDMHGNVCEWCLDWHDAYAGNAVDPVGPTPSDAPDAPKYTYRILRGGSWFYNAGGCRAACRNGSIPSYRSSDYGFRVACRIGTP